MDLYQMLADTPQIGAPDPNEAATGSCCYGTKTTVVETSDDDRSGLLLHQVVP
jgi:hypothetical protein